MKIRTLREKLVKYAKLLDPIIKKELKVKSTENGQKQMIRIIVDTDPINTAHSSATVIAETRVPRNAIIVYSEEIRRIVREDYEKIRQWYERNLAITVTKNQLERTVIVIALIHEICHLYQYNRVEWMFSIKFNRHHYIRQIEHSVLLKTCYIYMAHNRYLCEQFNILPFGHSFTSQFMILLCSSLQKDLYTLCNGCKENWSSYIDTVIPLLRNMDTKFYGFYIEKKTRNFMLHLKIMDWHYMRHMLRQVAKYVD